jgi:hypothetical protein
LVLLGEAEQLHNLAVKLAVAFGDFDNAFDATGFVVFGLPLAEQGVALCPCGAHAEHQGQTEGKELLHGPKVLHGRAQAQVHLKSCSSPSA